MMQHDFSKPTYVTSAEDLQKKKRLPVYILILVGLFLFSMLIHMISKAF
ncbi:hypothetical protein EC844_114100 [Acinetobacter calcoaceticus]|uniref:Uncharacterized protein n=1 Tax=Acinetobacter calcoaceticus TaxID=471 RepID=A0A4R1XNY9_ACICA|nr:hypothetical protein EC844_114100 [Acinetobacter calcoaceticus]